MRGCRGVARQTRPPDGALQASGRHTVSTGRVPLCLRPPADAVRRCTARTSGLSTAMGRCLQSPGGQHRFDMLGGRGAVVTFTDIGDRRAAQKALRERDAAEIRAAESQAAQRRILESATAARQQLVRHLHDGAQQRIVTMVLRLQMAREIYPASIWPSLMLPLSSRAPGWRSCVNWRRASLCPTCSAETVPAWVALSTPGGGIAACRCCSPWRVSPVSWCSRTTTCGHAGTRPSASSSGCPCSRNWRGRS